MSNQRQVVITGLGLRSPIGNTPAELATSLRSDRSGIVAMPEWAEIGNLRTRVAGICQEIDESGIERKVRRSMGRVSVLAALAARDAVADAGLDETAVASPDCGVSFGSTAGSTQALQEYMVRIFNKGSLKGMQSSTYLQFMSHTCAANLAMMFRTRGPVIASCTACVSGSQGIGYAYEQIRSGRAALMLGGGAEEMHFMDAGIFDIMRATSTKFNDIPERTPRPFDAARDGLVVAEGAGCVILEEYEHAKKRGARIWAEVLGYGTSCDGEHLTNPSAEGMAGALHAALADAGLSADAIEHVNAHATATAQGDAAEAEATHKVLGERVPVSALKGYMGHTLGGCGAIESIATIKMMHEGFMAPTRNLEQPDPALAPLGHILGEPREASFSIGMNNNFAFGGINTSLIFRKV
jgi:3-oxoacyl-[acyl-carrier-protein] synthase II